MSDHHWTKQENYYFKNANIKVRLKVATVFPSFLLYVLKYYSYVPVYSSS
jgi:hypothetical protein